MNGRNFNDLVLLQTGIKVLASMSTIPPSDGLFGTWRRPHPNFRIGDDSPRMCRARMALLRVARYTETDMDQVRIY